MDTLCEVLVNSKLQFQVALPPLWVSITLNTKTAPDAARWLGPIPHRKSSRGYRIVRYRVLYSARMDARAG
uniref:Unclassified n=1 Tax=Fusarium clavum TaxID=2594811 RepID=W1I9M9_9HYPO|nr:unclassified [Fusarium clavum]CEF82642.1 unclassified [Fusarium clavum]